jgi:hypothetical protein
LVFRHSTIDRRSAPKIRGGWVRVRGPAPSRWTSCTTAAKCDGIRIGTPGGEIAKLVGHGFVEISTANGQDAIAKVTWARRTSAHRG